MSETFENFFIALFYGSGSWLGFLIVLTLTIGLIMKWKIAAAPMMIANVIFALTYLDHNLGWHFIGSIFNMSFIVIYLVLEGKK